MINNFGQVPSQLLREPHPRRLTQDETALKLVRAELKRPDFTQFLDKVVQYYCELSTAKDPIVYLSPPRSPPRSFLQLSPDVLVSVSKGGILGCNSWMSYDKEQGFLLEIDATTTNLKCVQLTAAVPNPAHLLMYLCSLCFLETGNASLDPFTPRSRRTRKTLRSAPMASCSMPAAFGTMRCASTV